MILFKGDNFILANNKKGVWGFVWGMTLWLLMYIGFRIEMDSLIFNSLIGLKFFTELVFKDSSYVARCILAYSCFVSINGIYFVGKEQLG
jgi:hypothetical protein